MLAHNGQPLGQTSVADTWRVYHFLVPPASEGVTVSLQSDTFTPAAAERQSNDQRPYGLALDWAAFNPLTADATRQVPQHQHGCMLIDSNIRR
jgi:hypothetical protein